MAVIRFHDRQQAGRELSEHLQKTYGGALTDPVILALPRGGAWWAPRWRERRCALRRELQSARTVLTVPVAPLDTTVSMSGEADDEVVRMLEAPR